MDSHYNRSVPEEVSAFKRETKILWDTSLNRWLKRAVNYLQYLKRPHFQTTICLSVPSRDARQVEGGEEGPGGGAAEVPGNRQGKQGVQGRGQLSDEASRKQKTVTSSCVRMIESQKFVMTNLRNGIDYLKNTCQDVGMYMGAKQARQSCSRRGDHERLPVGRVGALHCL